MAQINIRVDDKIKREAETLFDSLGLTMSSAIMVFLRKSIAEHGIPFRIQQQDPSARPMSELLQRIDDMDHGRNCHEHTDEEMAQVMANAEKNAKRKKRRPTARLASRKTVT